MSILIKGVDLPKNRGLYIAIDNGDVYVKPLGELHWKQLEEKAVELPPHRDLIDREWLLDIALQLMNTAKNDDIFNGVKWLWQYILEAPTIIEAEEEDNG